jgi:peptidase M23-like protein
MAAVGRSTFNLLLGLAVVVVFGFTYLLGLWLYVLLTVPPAFAFLTLVARAWHARRGELEYGFLRNPFRREFRPYLAQAANLVLFWGLLAVAMSAGSLGALEELLADNTAALLRAGFWFAVVAMAGAALVPRRRIYVLTNILLSCGVLFLALQLVRIYTPPRDPVTIDMPFAGEWYVFSGGRAPLVNDHWSTSSQRHAQDIIQIVDGSSFSGDKEQLTSYHAFGKTLVAPADGRVTAILDTRPEVAIGDTDVSHPEGNYLVVDIGGGRYVMMGHLQRGSALVAAGDRVRRGQPLARVGNSGNTSEPHVHVQVQNKPAFAIDLAGLRTYPILWRDTVLTRGGDERGPAEVDARRDDRIRRAGR